MTPTNRRVKSVIDLQNHGFGFICHGFQRHNDVVVTISTDRRQENITVLQQFHFHEEGATTCLLKPVAHREIKLKQNTETVSAT